MRSTSISGSGLAEFCFLCGWQVRRHGLQRRVVSGLLVLVIKRIVVSFSVVVFELLLISLSQLRLRLSIPLKIQSILHRVRRRVHAEVNLVLSIFSCLNAPVLVRNGLAEVLQETFLVSVADVDSVLCGRHALSRLLDDRLLL